VSRTLFGDDDTDESWGPVYNQLPKHSPIARNTDPGTSHEAAAEVAGKLNRCQQGLLDAIQRLAAADAPTAGEAAANAYEADSSSSRETYRKRLGELVAAGRVVEAGKRRCRVTGKPARTFKIPKGVKP
jgi:hypothetical protein